MRIQYFDIDQLTYFAVFEFSQKIIDVCKCDMLIQFCCSFTCYDCLFNMCSCWLQSSN